MSSYSEGHPLVTPPTTNTDIIENDFLNKTGGDISDAPNQVIPHTTTCLRTRNIAARKGNVKSDTESDHMEQNKLKKTNTLKRDSPQTSSVTNTKLSLKSAKRHHSNILRDETNVVGDVLPEGMCVVGQDSSQEQPVSQINKDFEKLVNQGNYEEIFELGKDMSDEEFSKEICQAVKTLKQYNGVVYYLKKHTMMSAFYIHGNMGVIREVVIVESMAYNNNTHVWYAGLETALPLVLKEGYHDRFIDLLNVRMEITAEKDGPLKQRGETTSFEYFVSWFLHDLAPWWRDGLALKRFLTFRGDELRNKHPFILNAFCRGLVSHLYFQLHDSDAKKLLIDLIGQPLLLTPVTFTREFLRKASDKDRSNFINYGWDETIKEGLKNEYEYGGKELWRMMKMEYPRHFFGDYPNSEEKLAAVLAKFPTKQELEERWVKENTPTFMKNFEKLFIDNFLPIVLARIVFDYADPKPTWLDV